MSLQTRSTQPVGALRPGGSKDISGGRDGGPAHWQLLAAGLLLALLWVLVLVALRMMFASGPWFWRALAITTATVTVACIVRIIRPRRRVLAGASGALAGLVFWVWRLADTGRLDAWWHTPQAMIDEIRWRILVDSAPLETGGPLEDALLLAIVIATAMTVLMLVGRWHPLFAGAFAALFLLIPSAATGESVGWPTLSGVGMLLALLAWIGSPSPNRAGLLAAALAVAVAAGAMTVAPATRDRVWTEASPPSPFSESVPDVTIALAENLRQRSGSRAFTFSSTRPGAYRFTLATLSEFTDGRWQPQDDLNQEGLVVSDPRNPALLTPEPIDTSVEATAGSVTVTIDGLLSSWLPLPQSTVRVTESVDRSGFDPTRWQWTAEANTARGEGQETLRGHEYVADVQEDALGTVARGRLYGALPEATRLFADPGDAPAELAPYLMLPGQLPEAIAEAAEQVAGGAGDRLAVGDALERWFRGGGFTYDEKAPYRPGLELDDPFQVMERFLEERRGFCVHYAATFAVMARHLGAPTRVAVGYAVRAAGEDDTVVRGNELHAWPEIYVADAGWVSFEPTPGGAGARADGASDGWDADELPGTSEIEATDEAAEEGNPAQRDPEIPEEPMTTEAGQSNTASDPGPPIMRTIIGWVAALVVVALLCAPAAGRQLRTYRRRRALAQGDRAATPGWEELRDTAVDLGLFTADPEHPGPRAQTAEALVDHLEARRALAGDAATAARTIAGRMAAERYGNGCQTAGPQIEEDTEELLWLTVAELRAGASRGARLRARLLPRSMRPGPPGSGPDPR